MAGSSGFAISIGIQDRATAGLDAINKRISALTAPAEKFNRSLSKFGDVTGINRAAEGMATLGNRTLGAARAIERMAGPMASITSAASIAGMVELSRRWADAGTQIGKVSYRLNAPVEQISKLDGAAKLAGSSAEAMEGSLQGLGDKLADANFGRNAPLAGLLNTLHIGFKGLNGQARTGADALGDVADAVQRLKDPHAQTRLLEQLGISTDLLPMLKDGRAGLEAFEKKARQTGGVMTSSMVDAATKMKGSWSELGLSIDGIVNHLEEKWAPTVTHALDGISHWIEKNQKLAGSIGEIGAAITAAAAIKPALWFMRLLGLGGVAEVAAPAAVVGAAAVATYKNGQSEASDQDRAAQAGYTEPTGTMNPDGSFTAYRNPKTGDVKSWMQFDPKYNPNLPPLPDRTPGTNASMPDTMGLPGVVGPRPAPNPRAASITWDAIKKGFLDTLAGPESHGQYNIKNGGSHFSSYEAFPEGVGPGGASTAAGRYQFTSGTWHSLGKTLGLKDFSPASQDKAAWYLAATRYHAKTGADLEADLRAGKTQRVAEVLGPTWPSLPGGSQSHQTQQQFDVALARNTAAAQSGPMVAGGATPDGPAPALTPPTGAVHVEVSLKGAPPGTTATAQASGIATAAPPRIETAMATVR